MCPSSWLRKSPIVNPRARQLVHTEAPRGSFKVVLQSCSSFGLMPTAPSCPTELQYLHLPLLGVSHTFEGGGHSGPIYGVRPKLRSLQTLTCFNSRLSQFGAAQSSSRSLDVCWYVCLSVCMSICLSKNFGKDLPLPLFKV